MIVFSGPSTKLPHPQKTKHSRKLLPWVAVISLVSLLFLMWHTNLWAMGRLEHHRQQNVRHQASSSSSSSLTRPKSRSEEEFSTSGHGEHDSQEKRDYEFHIVFSTGCNALQDWQQYMFFYHAMASGFKGNVTRIASGCENEKGGEDLLRKFHKEQISIMSPNFHLHTTPDFTHTVPGPKYNFFNKPLGMRHWMQYGLGFPENQQAYENVVIVLMDPDQFLVRPFTNNLTQEIWVKDLGFREFAPGKPMAARYGFGGAWVRNYDFRAIFRDTTLFTGVKDSVLFRMSLQEATDSYSVGPPYTLVASDMYKIVIAWADLVVPMYKQTKGGTFMAEMYAYSAAAAHLEMPHQLTGSFMISDHSSGNEEAWARWIDGKSSEQVCSPELSPIPHSLHFCQRYYLGPYFFSKYQLPKVYPDDMFLSCEHPLLAEPPHNAADIFQNATTPNGEFNTLRPKDRIRMAFFLCQMLPRLNAAATFYKDHHCPSSNSPGMEPTNYSKVFFFELHEVKKERLARERVEREKRKKAILQLSSFH